VLFLNPPYGWNLGDKEAGGKRVRLEHQLLQHFFPALRADGLLIYIVPKASFGEACQKWLLARFDDIGVWLAATGRFDQIVIIARKRKAASAQLDQAQLDQFAAWQTGKEPWPTLPETAAYRYHPAANSKALLMQSKLLDAQGMAALTRECPGLWHDFTANFCRSDNHAAIRPVTGPRWYLPDSSCSTQWRCFSVARMWCRLDLLMPVPSDSALRATPPASRPSRYSTTPRALSTEAMVVVLAAAMVMGP